MERRKRRLKMDFPPSPMRCADPPFGEICAPPQTIVSTGSQISFPSVVSCSTAWIRLWGSLRDSRIPLRDREQATERSADSLDGCRITHAALGATASWTAAVPCRFRIARRRWKSARGIGSLHASPIPTGLCPPAQGCEALATLGAGGEEIGNPNGVVAWGDGENGRNPVGVGHV